MASYLQIENISKSYGPKVLFEKIGFNINEGDKIALIAPNGTGKTSLMRILAGKDKSDSGGKIMFLKDIKIAFLEQEYDFEPERSIFDQIMTSSIEFTKDLDQEHLWEYEHRVVKFLTSFNLTNPDQKMKELSGGEVKRVALTQMLASEAEFFIMDEPTNHLDIDAIEFLEGYLSRSRCTLFMVTHDRYFLDRVTTRTMEIEHRRMRIYNGGYTKFIEQKEKDKIIEQRHYDNTMAEVHRIEKIIEQTGLKNVENELTRNVSRGYKQRVSLAGAIVGDPKILILDEPTTGLHQYDIKKLLTILNRIVDNGDTVLVIEHNLDVIKQADYIIDLGPEGGDDGGTIIFEGAPEKIIKCEESYTGKFLKKSSSFVIKRLLLPSYVMQNVK